jgi:hypothetical protein
MCYVTFLCYFVFTTTLSVYWPAHFDANYCNTHATVIDIVPKAQKNLIGLNDSYINFKEIHGRSHVSNNNNKQWQHTKTKKKNNTTHDSNDVAIVSMEIHT